MKTYDAIVGNYGIVIEYRKGSKVFTGHIDYLGKSKNKRSGNSFMASVSINKIRYDYPELVTKQVEKYLYNVLLDIKL